MNLYKNEKFFSVENDINKEKKLQEELFHKKEKLLDLNLNEISAFNKSIRKMTSDEFWKEVEKIMPEYKKCKEELKQIESMYEC